MPLPGIALNTADNTVQTFNQSEPVTNNIPKEIKNEYQKQDVIKFAEGAGAQHASSGKTGKILAGIAGAVLTAVGLAAATAAVLATAGIGLGIMAGAAAFVGGITGTSIIAGVSGCAGIGLITASAKMKANTQVLEAPAQNTSVNNASENTTKKDSIIEQLAVQQGNRISENNINVEQTEGNSVDKKKPESLKEWVIDICENLKNSNKSSPLIGDMQLKAQAEQLKKMGVDKPEELNGEGKIDPLLELLEYDDETNSYGINNDMQVGHLEDIADQVLNQISYDPVKDFNQKNVLKVKMALNNFFATGAGKRFQNMYGIKREGLNNHDVKKLMAEFFMNSSVGADIEADRLSVKAAITFAALFMDDISKLPEG